MEQRQDDLAERIDMAAERYWLQGMDLGYAKRRALVEITRDEMPQQVQMFLSFGLGAEVARLPNVRCRYRWRSSREKQLFKLNLTAL